MKTEVFTKIADARAKIGSSSVTSEENQKAQGELSSALFPLDFLDGELSRTQEQSKC